MEFLSKLKGHPFSIKALNFKGRGGGDKSVINIYQHSGILHIAFILLLLDVLPHRV